MTVLVDEKLSATAAYAIGERARWQIMESLPQVCVWGRGGGSVCVRESFSVCLHLFECD